MSFDITDDSEKMPIDLFAPRASTEGFAFPIEHFLPGQKEEPLDEPASTEPVEELNVEVNPNKPDSTYVDVVETVMIPEHISIGIEHDGLTDTPMEPIEATLSPELRVSLEQDLEELGDLNLAYQSLRKNGGITKADVLQIENAYPGLITKHKPINTFSSVVSVCGFAVSCESIGDRICALIDGILEMIGRIIERLLGGGPVNLSSTITSMGSDAQTTLKSQYDNILLTATRLDSGNRTPDIAKRVIDSEAARKSSTLKHFVRLYPVELIKVKTSSVAAGFNLVQDGTAVLDLVNIDRLLTQILATVNRSIITGQVESFADVPTQEFRERYTNMVRGRVPNIEAMVNIKTPDAAVANIRKHVTSLKRIQMDLTAKKQTLIGDTDATNSLKSVANAMRAVDACTVKMDIVLQSYTLYKRIISMSLNQTNTKLQLFRLP